MSRVFNNVKDLEHFLGNIVREAVDAAMEDTGTLERLRQKQLAQQTAEQDDNSQKKNVDEAEEETEEETSEETITTTDVAKPGQEKIADPQTGDIFKMLNLMRSGKSVKDAKVKKALTTYIEQLTTAEKQSLYVFLAGLADMMVDGEPGTLALDPGKAGIEMKPTEKPSREEETEEIKVTTVKTKEEEGDEDMPIVVGEAADKSGVRMKIRELWK
tara:strand:+ start:28734 stop:29378 length:645 start_codon:yes stop_codon:yes gene_type:complete